MVKIYSRQECNACWLAKRQLKKRGIPYQEVAMEESEPEVGEWLKSEGFYSLPVIEVGEGLLYCYKDLTKVYALIEKAKGERLD